MTGWRVGRVVTGVTALVAVVDDSLDTSTTTHAASSPSRQLGDLMIAFLATRGDDSAVITDGDPEWTLWLATLAPPYSSPLTQLLAYDRTATADSQDSLNWSFAHAVEAAAVVVEIRPPGLTMGDSDYASGLPASSSSLSAVIDGRAVLVYVMSDGGATVTDGELLYRTPPSTFSVGFGYFECWLIRSTGTVPVDVAATSGNLKFVGWIEIQ